MYVNVTVRMLYSRYKLIFYMVKELKTPNKKTHYNSVKPHQNCHKSCPIQEVKEGKVSLTVTTTPKQGLNPESMNLEDNSLCSDSKVQEYPNKKGSLLSKSRLSPTS